MGRVIRRVTKNLPATIVSGPTFVNFFIITLLSVWENAHSTQNKTAIFSVILKIAQTKQIIQIFMILQLISIMFTFMLPLSLLLL